MYKKIFKIKINYNKEKLEKKANEIVQKMGNNLSENLNCTNTSNRKHHLYGLKAELLFEQIFNCKKSPDNFSKFDFISSDGKKFFDLKSFNTDATPEIAQKKRYRFFVQAKQIEKHKDNLAKTFIIIIYWKENSNIIYIFYCSNFNVSNIKSNYKKIKQNPMNTSGNNFPVENYILDFFVGQKYILIEKEKEVLI